MSYPSPADKQGFNGAWVVVFIVAFAVVCAFIAVADAGFKSQELLPFFQP